MLIADEPTTALDVTVQGEILELLRELQKSQGTSVILITHDMGVVAEMADRVIIMRHGRVVEQGTTLDIFARPQADYTRELLAAVPRMGTAGPKAGDRPGKQRRQRVSRSCAFATCMWALICMGGFLGRVQRRVHAVEGVSFDVAPNETVSLVGEVRLRQVHHRQGNRGAGAFTGEISVGGRNLPHSAAPSAMAVKRDVQMIFQDPYASLDPRMRVGDLVAEPLLIHGIGSARRAPRSDRLSVRTGRTDCRADGAYPHEFSGGQRQRICIARALALKPKLIIADESVSALDVSVQARVLKLLKELQAEFGLSYLFISHDMAVVENISDRVAVMYLGQIVEMGTRNQIFTNPSHPYTRRLIDAVPRPDPRSRRPNFTRLDSEIPSPVRKIGDEPRRLFLVDKGAGHLVAEETGSTISTFRDH